MIPRATYRLQLTRDFPFSAAVAIVPYLSKLGVSHAYLSPITTARSGSTHGYDVIDPTRISPELGGEDGFRSLVAALRDYDMGVIIDIVPNHMGVAGGENRYWNDVLRHGADSAYARWFDIDWTGPIVLPGLGAPLVEVIAAGDIVLVEDGDDPHLLLYGEQRLPLRPGSLDGTPGGGDRLRVVIERQHYRPVYWRTANDRLNWRRFFAINELAGLRIEDPAVFEATQRLYFDLFAQGLIDGVRIDHVDGLTDPAGYCRAMRARLDANGNEDRRAIIIVEKILAADEPLATDWGIDGTSGYDFMRDVTALLHDPEGETALKEAWQRVDPAHGDAAQVVLQARQDMLDWQFEGQLAACVAAFDALAQSVLGLEHITPAMWRRAVERLLWVFPVYRTYGDGRSAPRDDAAARERAWADVQPHLPPGEKSIARQVIDWLAGDGVGDAALAVEAVRRFQQLSAPIAAKGVEDTAFYRYAPLLSANDVGSAPEQFAIPADLFHKRAAARAADFPNALLATATHDHKRGEDMRARLAVLSAVPDLWAENWKRWDAISGEAGPVHPADRYQLWQTLVGAWPEPNTTMKAFHERMSGWLQKTLREARLRSSWEEPDAGYESRAQSYLAAVLGNAKLVSDIDSFVHSIRPAAIANSLVQTVLKFCAPGVPDIYQGCEALDLSLVDPDNRRPVDYDRRHRWLTEPDGDDGVKIALVRNLLALRKSAADLFAHGDYRPLSVTGRRASNVLAFERTYRNRKLFCAVQIRSGKVMTEQGGQPPASWWGNTRIERREEEAAAFFSKRPYVINLYE
ncbi:malto-oligosyltrehalose synthase [Sphingobium amiense]|uniref:Malto-oligosyltrehalose synthase n=1 Tax=Sphingobium amiense TaxID=135719 RepID=A0A494W904_9SPHN|nr:malto-oligosyltrehalose synthase [Sphingobium amiense]BBD96915.1 malto-oligosyltrehalose synthase [Sphingobium amiense]